jgi:conjugal transfer pilus assembly protein TraW
MAADRASAPRFRPFARSACVLALVAVISPAQAVTSRIGRVWPIAEPDALAEIEAAAAKLPPMAPKFGPRSRWTALQSASLGVTARKAERSVVPFYTLPDDLKLPDGRTLYPKGFTFNPLAYVRLAQRLVIVHPNQIDWALARARPEDWIIVASGDGRSVDPLALGAQVGRPIFILEAAVKERLGLTVAPVIVTQVGQKLVLDEEPVEAAGRARETSR